jgi:hypothetical protein
LWFEYRDLKARRKVIEAEDEAEDEAENEAELEAEAEAEAKDEDETGQTASPKPGSIPARHDVDDEPTDIQGMLSIESPRLQLWLRYEQVHKIRHNPATARS